MHRTKEVQIELLQTDKMWYNLFYIIQIVERKIPMILKYMYNDQVCSIIDVDMQNEKVSVTNFTKDIYLTKIFKIYLHDLFDF